jgi:hypothetical protein
MIEGLDNQAQISVWLSNALIIKTKNPIIKSINTQKKAWYHSLFDCNNLTIELSVEKWLDSARKVTEIEMSKRSALHRHSCKTLCPGWFSAPADSMWLQYFFNVDPITVNGLIDHRVDNFHSTLPVRVSTHVPRFSDLRVTISYQIW